MKIKPADSDRFLSAPPAGTALILLYGPDEGLVRDRSQALAKRITGDPPDPMRLIDLTETDLKTDPARLIDEATSLSLVPGDRLVRARLSGDSLASLIKTYLDDCATETIKPDALVVVEAGDLGPRSSLRAAAEASPQAGAVACYQDDARTLDAVIRASVKQAGLTIDPQAADLLSQRLGGDRGISRQEIEKLILYKGAEGGTITPEDVDLCVPGDSETAAESLADLVAGGDIDAADQAFGRALQSDLTPVGLLRILSTHFQRLHLWAAEIEGGKDPASVLKQARPPVFFKRQSAILNQLRAWRQPDLETALTAFSEAERQCKTTGMPDVLICHRTILSLARRAQRQRR